LVPETMKGFECSIDFPKPIGRKKMEKATAVLGNWMFLPKTAAGKGGTVEFNMTDLVKKKELKGDRKRNGEYMKGFCMNGEYKVFYKIRNKLSEMLEKDLSSVTFFCFEQRHEGRWKLVILESSEEDEMEEKRWSPKWSQEKVTRFLYKALCQTEFFTDLGLTKHFFDKENKDMAKLINQIEERREITPKISAFSMKMFKGFAELNSPAPVKKREETKL